MVTFLVTMYDIKDFYIYTWMAAFRVGLLVRDPACLLVSPGPSPPGGGKATSRSLRDRGKATSWSLRGREEATSRRLRCGTRGTGTKSCPQWKGIFIFVIIIHYSSQFQIVYLCVAFPMIMSHKSC